MTIRIDLPEQVNGLEAVLATGPVAIRDGQRLIDAVGDGYGVRQGRLASPRYREHGK